MLFSQNENKIWYFGNSAGLDFSSNPPTVLTNGVLNSLEGCTSVADNTGGLLFYTDGVTVWDRTHSIMINGTSLNGNISSTQSAAIVKQPGNNNIYYIFTQFTSTTGLCYSVVDLNLAFGNGAVTQKNIFLANTGCEKLTTTRHCNGSDTWVLTHDNFSTNYRAYLVTAAGVNTMAVISSAGTGGNGHAIGYLKISPTGKRLVSALWGFASLEVYDFNNSTGSVSNALNLGTSFPNAYGCEFSPDGSKLYAGMQLSPVILQWDLCAGTNAAIIASQSTVGVATGAVQLGALQVAPNGKIYVARYNSNFLGVIDNPNALGIACNFINLGQSTGTAICKLGLPNLMSRPAPPPPFTYTVNSTYACYNVDFSHPNPSSYLSCPSAGYSLLSLVWDFGDPPSGAANSSTLSTPYHVYPSNGTYNVRLILNYSCGGGTDTIYQSVNVNLPCVTVASSSISCASLGSATVSVAGGVGPYTYSWMPSGQTTSVVNGLSPGSYTIQLYDLGNSYSFSTVTVFSPPLALSGNFQSTGSISCNGAGTGTAQISGVSGGSGNQSYWWFNGNMALNTASVNNLSAGNWTLIVTDVLTACALTQTFFINQPSPVITSFTIPVGVICAGAPFMITAQNSGGTPVYSYSWTNGPAANTTTITENTAGTYVYTLNSTDANNCEVSHTVQTVVVPNPLLSVSSISICPNALGFLNANGAASYTWYASPTVSVTGTTYSDTPLSNKLYTVVGSALGCTAVAFPYIMIKPLPTPGISANSPLCELQNLQLNGTGGVSYMWSGPQTYTSYLSSPLITSVQANQSGVYSVTVTGANSCTASSTYTVLVHPTPSLTALGTTVCLGQQTNLLSSSVNGCSFLWKGPGGFFSTLQNPPILNSQIAISGNYSIMVTDPFGCKNSKTINLLVLNPPQLVVTSINPATVCARPHNGSQNTISFSFYGASSYTLLTPSYINNSNTFGPSTNLSLLPSAMPPQTHVTATLQAYDGFCPNTALVNFSIIPNPNLNFVSTAPEICAGQRFSFHCQGAYSYTWTTPSSTIFSVYGPSLTVSPTVSTVYSVVGESRGCKSLTQNLTLTVNPIPDLKIIPNVKGLCIGSNLQLQAVGSGNSFTWTPAVAISSLHQSTVLVNPVSQQNYTLYSSLKSCTNSAVIMLSVWPLPTIGIAVKDASVCVNDSICLKGSGGSSYFWKGPANSELSGQSLKFVVPSSQYTGDYSLTVIDTNACAVSSSSFILVQDLPQGYLLADKSSACAPFCTELKFKSNAGSSAIEAIWDLDGIKYDRSAFKFCAMEAGNFVFNGHLIDTMSGCKNETEFTLKAYPKPSADFSFTPMEPMEGLEEVEFINTSQGKNQSHWKWNFMTNQGYKLDKENTSYLFQNEGFYPIALVVSNEWFCSDTIVKSIHVISDLSVFIPNVFSPNGDGLNEVFLPIVNHVSDYQLKVFDRWGSELFSTNDPEQGWDGRFKEVECKNDVYIYKLSVSKNNQDPKQYKGHVTLNR